MMKMSRNPLWLGLIAAVLMLWASPAAFGQQLWYIHAEDGDDANSGHTADAPFRTIERFIQATGEGDVQDGSEVLLAGTFRESFIINMLFAGDARRLTVRQWLDTDPGSASLKLPQAVLRGDKLAKGWTRAGTTDRYTATVPQGLWLASVVWNWDINVDLYGRHRGHLTPVTSIAAVEVTPYSWFYAGTTLHVNVTAPKGPHTNASNGQVAYVPYGENGGVTIANGVGCVVKGIHTYLWLNDVSGSYGISQEHSTNGLIVDCVTRDTSHHGIGYTGATRDGNRIAGCVVSGLMGLRVDNNADAFGFLSSGNAINSGSVEECTAHCYSLLTPSGTPLNPQRNIHGFRCGTTRMGQFISGFEVNGLTIYSYYPECGQISTAIRLEDTRPPTDPLDPASYGVKFDRLRIVRGGYQNFSGENGHASFVNSNFDMTDCSRRGLQGSGAITCNFGLVSNNKILMKNSRIIANVDHPNGPFWTGAVFMLQTGLSLYLVDSVVDEVGLRARGSTAAMFGWFNSQGRVFARGTSFTFRYPFGLKRLCFRDGTVTQPGRDFDSCRYVGLSAGPYYTEWYGPAFGLPDIRTQAGWFSSALGDLNGTASNGGPVAPASSSVNPGANENEDDETR